MKNIILLIACFALPILSTQAQATWTRSVVKEAEVPIAVKNTQTVMYPNVKVDRWEKATGTVNEQSKTKYIAIFKQFNQRVRARYQSSGTGLSATTYFLGTKLPQAIQDAAATNYSEFKLKSGEKIQSLTGPEKYVYRIRLRKGSQKLVIYVDENGKEIEKGEVPAMMKEDEEVEG